MKPLCIIDFETEEIEKRPKYPPVPVGVAIIEPNKSPYYMAWGHPVENNCTKTEVKRKLKELYSKYRIGCHNGRFDLEVGEKFFNLSLEPRHGWEDSMLLAFLNDPREKNLKLKSLADKYLSMPPDEQTKLRDWIFKHVEGAKRAKTKWGKYIYLAPAKLVGRYAKGDVIRTKELINKFYKVIKDKGMMEQYGIEKRVAIKAIILERQGVKIDIETLEPELIKAKKKLKRAENAVFKTLGNINLNSHPQKVKAFEDKGLVKQWEYNKKFNRRTYQWEVTSKKTSIDSLMRVCIDKKLVKYLEIYSKYTKLIGTYMEPWLESALENNGLFFPWYNTIKGENDKGTYTGRLSSNFQQVPRKPSEVFKGMPFLRNFIIPDKKSHCLFNRDWMGQELRIMAHFSDGSLMQAYNDNPYLDGHKFVSDVMTSNTGIDYGRSAVKGCNFLVIYGGGDKALARNINVSLDVAKEIFQVHGEALPELDELKDELNSMARNNEKFKTAGGRWYDFENGKEYVAVNTLIQGSAGDHAKRGFLNISDAIDSYDLDARINLFVHDEFMLSGAKKQKNKIMKAFKEAMEYDELFDVPMLTDGKIGERWGSMTRLEKGK